MFIFSRFKYGNFFLANVKNKLNIEKKHQRVNNMSFLQNHILLVNLLHVTADLPLKITSINLLR